MRINVRLSILDDLASDMRADYRDMLTYGWSPEEAENEIINCYMNDIMEDEELTAWCVLAKEAWAHGHRPGKNVLDEAIKRLDIEIQACQQEQATAADQQYLSRLTALKEQLLSPPPAPKKLYGKKPILSPWKLGDCVVITMTGDSPLEGQYAVFRVIEIEKKKQSKYSPVENETAWLAPLFWYGTEAPEDISMILSCGYTEYQPEPLLPPWMKELFLKDAPHAHVNEYQQPVKAIQCLFDHSKGDRELIASWPVYHMNPAEHPLPDLKECEKNRACLDNVYSLRWKIATRLRKGSPYFVS